MDMVTERYKLTCDRIREIAAAQEVAGIYKEFYKIMQIGRAHV